MQLSFEPVSELYEDARKEYIEGLVSRATLENASPHELIYKNSSLNLQKYHFGVCVSILRLLYSMGEVENVDRLPLPLQLVFFDFNEKKLESLVSNLEESYFPTLRPEELERINKIKKRQPEDITPVKLYPYGHNLYEKGSRNSSLVVKLK